MYLLQTFEYFNRNAKFITRTFLSSYKTKQSFKDNISEDIQFSTQKYKMKTCGFFFCPTILNDETPDSDTEKRIR